MRCRRGFTTQHQQQTPSSTSRAAPPTLAPTAAPITALLLSILPLGSLLLVGAALTESGQTYGSGIAAAALGSGSSQTLLPIIPGPCSVCTRTASPSTVADVKASPTLPAGQQRLASVQHASAQHTQTEQQHKTNTAERQHSKLNFIYRCNKQSNYTHHKCHQSQEPGKHG
jgi:hypothetical protein